MADYIYPRGNQWWFQFRWPKDAFWEESYRGKLIRRPLNTTDRAIAKAEAAVQAAGYIHHIAMIRARMRAKAEWIPTMVPKQAVGTTVAHADGTFTTAINDEWIIFVDEAGQPIARAPEQNAKIQLGKKWKFISYASPADERADNSAVDYFHAKIAESRSKRTGKPVAPVVRASNKDRRDEEIIDFWVLNKGIRSTYANEARTAVADLKKLFPGVTLETATYTQAMALGRFYFIGEKQYARTGPSGKSIGLKVEGEGIDPGTAQKKVRWLSTAMREARRMTPEVKVNPFEGVDVRLISGDVYEPKQKRLPFDAEDTRRFVAAIPFMKPHHRILALLALTTGMRPVEAVSIRGEQLISDFSCVTIGAKLKAETTASGKKKALMAQRTIPLPSIVRNHIPQEIKGYLFPDAPHGDKGKMRRYMTGISNDMNGYVRSCGIQNPLKSFYSTRKRAITVLTNKRCPTDIILEIVGHDEHDGVHRSYIQTESSYPRADIDYWIKKIWEDIDFSALEPVTRDEAHAA